MHAARRPEPWMCVVARRRLGSNSINHDECATHDTILAEHFHAASAGFLFNHPRRSRRGWLPAADDVARPFRAAHAGLKPSATLLGLCRSRPCSPARAGCPCYFPPQPRVVVPPSPLAVPPPADRSLRIFMSYKCAFRRAKARHFPVSLSAACDGNMNELFGVAWEEPLHMQCRPDVYSFRNS